MNDPDLPLFLPRGGPSRKTDPSTSKAAGASVDVNALQQKVLDALADYGPLTDEQIDDLCGGSGRSTYRTRRTELAAKGLVVPTGDKRPLRSGRLAIVWKLAT